MAIPIGTTSRQMGALVRWLFAGLVVVGMVSWWMPSYQTWGALAGGLVVAFSLWVCWQTVTCNRSVPGHPLYIVLLIPAAVLTVHLAATGLGSHERRGGLGGSLNMSMLFTMALWALSILLSQSLLPKGRQRTVAISLTGGAMIAGSLAAAVWADSQMPSATMTLIGCAGLAVWLTPLFQPRALPTEIYVEEIPRFRELRIGCVVLAVLAGGGLIWNSPSTMALAGAILGLVLIAGGLVFAGRKKLAAIGAALTVVGGTVCWGLGGVSFAPTWVRNGVLGKGEDGFADVCASSTGVEVLIAVIGVPATVLVVLGFMLCLVILLRRSSRDTRLDQTRAIVWAAGAAFSACAMLAPGGLFIPAVVLAVGFIWGAMPAMVGRGWKPQPGFTVLVVLVAVMILLGLARSSSLLTWILEPVYSGRIDKLMHGIVGFLLSLVLAWLMGARKVTWGLVGVAIAAMTGGVGEALQQIASTRAVEYGDWVAHVIGSVLATGPYLLSVGARLCESADVRLSEERMDSRYV